MDFKLYLIADPHNHHSVDGAVTVGDVMDAAARKYGPGPWLVQMDNKLLDHWFSRFHYFLRCWLSKFLLNDWFRQVSFL